MEHKEFYNNTANQYDLRQDNPSTNYLRNQEKEIIQIFAGGDVLDIGCGTGFHLQLLERLRRDGIEIGNIAGLDISKNMLLEARKGLTNSVRLICTDAKKLPFENSSLGTILCMNSTLNLIGDCVIPEMSRVLKENGRVIISFASIWEK